MNDGKGLYVGGTLISILISLALYLSGRRESACRKQRISPRAAAALAFICRARPGGEAST